MPGVGSVWPPVDAVEMDVHDLYDRLADSGTTYGPAFQGLRRVWRRGNEVFGEVRLPDGEPVCGGFGIHPALFDSALQAWAVLGTGTAGQPFSWSRVRLRPSPATDLRVRLRPAGPDAVALTATDSDGRTVVTVGSLVYREAPDVGRYPGRHLRNALFTVGWTPVSTVAVTTGEANAPHPEHPVAEICAVATRPGGDDPTEQAEAARAATVAILRRIQDHLLSDHRPGDGPLAVLTHGAVSTAPDDPAPDPVGAAVRGLVRAAQADHPGRFVLVDLDQETAPQRLVDAAVASGEPELAVRAGTVYAPRLVSATPRAHATADPRPFRTEGTVLIVGGTGALASRTARRLVTEHGVRHLLLTRGSRDRGAGGPGSGEWGGLDDLEADATVTVADCDPADPESLRTLLSRAQPPVSAVVLSDGDDGTAAMRKTPAGSLDPDQLTTVLRTRAHAAAVLHELTRDLRLDAFVLFSSAASVVGGAGRSGHAAADAFLDALAARRTAAGLPGLSIAWGPLAGLIPPDGSADDHPHTAWGLVELGEEHTGALLDAALRCAAGAPTVVAAPVDTASLRRRGDQVPPLLRGLVPARTPAADAGNETAKASMADRLTSLAPAERDRVLLGAVRDSAAAVLGHSSRDQVGPDTPFKELGVDSVAAVGLRNRLNAMTGLRLPATVVFDCPTARDLARRVNDELFPASASGDPGTVGTPAESVGAPPIALEEGKRPPGGEPRAAEPIAILGMACRLPGDIRSPEDLWEVLLRGDDVIGEFPGDRGWDLDGLFDPDPDAAGKSYVRHGGFLTDMADFDAGLFGINPREALAMDPQQRLLLQTAWEAFERAGIAPPSMRGSRTGVFVGLGYHDYGGHWTDAPAELGGYLGNGISGSIASGRIAYTFGLEGPAVTVDTACSSSLVSLHQAVQSLRLGECDMALAGGATVMSTPGEIIELCRQRGLSPDGRCKAFGADADGFGIAEGVGLLLLAPLSRARREGRPVLAVIRGSAVNQDGRSNGLTAPSGPAQRKVIRQALANGGLRPGDVDAVEAHGTGTALGDPIEARELLATYGQDRPTREPVWLGSLKSNIGHAQFAAGVAGVIKTVLALRAGVLPATLHAERPSPHVDWSSGALRLLTEARPWPDTGRPRRAAVSSFGMSGTNAHVVLEQEVPEQAPADPAQAPDGDARDRDGTDGAPVPFLLSGVGERALHAQAARLRAHLADHPGAALRDVAFSLATTRSELESRAVVLAGDRDDLLARLDALAQGHPVAGAVQSTTASRDGVVFVFPGQGAQWRGMGLELFEQSPVFAARLAACADALRPFTGWDLLDVLRERPGAPSPDDTDVVQPALFAVMVALAELWRSLGVEPSAVVGHSQGEIAAACVAGALSLADAARLVAVRSATLLAIAGQGAMASIFLPPPRVEERLRAWDGRVVVAAVNGPESTVVSGDADAVAELLARCAADGVRTRRIPVDIASHSPHVEAVRDRLASALGPIDPHRERVPIYSATEAGPIDGTGLDADYWYENLRRPVRFEAAVRRLLEEGHQVFVEVSAHPVLTTGIQETLEACSASGTVTGTLRRDEGGLARALLSAGELWAAGTPVDWRPAVRGGRRVPLPTYAFQTKRYWLDPSGTGAARGPAGSATGAAESGFWAAVEDGDAQTLAAHLGPDAGAPQAVLEALAPAVPVLSAWRRRRRDRSQAEGCRYDIAWRPWTVPCGPTLTGRWLLVSTADGAGADRARQIGQAVRERGGQVVPLDVPPGTGREKLAALLRESMIGGAGPAGVVCLLATAEGADAEHPAVPERLALTLALVQALGDAQVMAPLWTVTQGAVSASPDDTAACPEQAAVWGLARTAALEMPERWGGLVDLPPTVTDEDLTRLCDLLAADAPAPGAEGEDQVALRPDGALVRRLVRAAPSDAALPEADEATPWRPRGTVLLTGATGAIGPHLVRWLAGGGADRIVCTSRSGGLPTALADVGDELAPTGVRLEAVACDVADRAAVEDLVETVEARGGPIRAVVHAAASIRLHPLQETSPRLLADAMAAKSAGARNLDEVFAERDLDAFVLFSSIAGVWGSGRHGAYAAANAYLDALAQRRRERGLRALSVAWGLWNTTERWGAGGPPTPVLTAERQGLPVMPPQLAVAALQQALDRDRTFAVVVDVAWERFLPRFSSARRRPLLDEIPSGAPAPDPGRDAGGADGTEHDTWRTELAGLPPAERERRLLDLVHSTAAAVLGHSDTSAVATGRPLRELGLDSLTSVELRNRLNTATGLRLPTAVVFEYPTIAALAQRIAEDLTDEPRADTAAPHTEAVPPTRTGTDPRSGTDPIAIVSMACRLPGAVRSPEDLWDLLTAGTDAITTLPADRGWDVEGIYDPQRGRAGTTYTRHGGFLHDPAGFDPGFFDITEAEAPTMDPQQRLLLETSWEAFERAGIDLSTLRGSSTGVYVGSRYQGYGAGAERSEGWLPHFGAGDLISMLSGRISYVLGLEGPAVTVDTACSSSMVALHLAAQALRQGECSLALAGGVTIMAGPSELIGLSGAGELSPDGRCKAFSADADGMGMAEGVGVVLLERLSDARRNGHPVLAVIRGSAVNQDGAGNGLAAPNAASQRKVIRQALAFAGLPPRDVDAVEAHGTGTALGDTIEAQALGEVYGADRPAGRPLRLGTVKSNIGHTQSASGVTGVIKMVLAMRHGVLPRTLHADRRSTQVDWSGGVELLTEELPWPRTDRPRRAGISSFGMSGTNTHLVLEEPGEEPGGRPPPATPASPGPFPWPLSARTGPALSAQAGRLAAFLASAPDTGVEDIGLSLAAGRTAFEHRAVLLSCGPDGFREALDALEKGRAVPDVVTGPKAQAPPGAVAFELAAPDRQGPDSAAVQELMAWSAAYAETMRLCDDAFAEAYGERLLDGARGRLRDGAAAEPAAFAAEVATAALWRSFGVRPDGPGGDGPLARCLDGRLAPADAVRMLASGPGGSSREPIRPARDTVAPLAAPLRVAGRQEFLRVAAELWVRGVPVDFRPAVPGGRRTPLPTYAFQRRRYWAGG